LEKIHTAFPNTWRHYQPIRAAMDKYCGVVTDNAPVAPPAMTEEEPGQAPDHTKKIQERRQDPPGKDTGKRA
jgi:hypothetical protein